MSTYHFVPDLSQETQEVPADSILSRSLLRNEDLRAVLFSFAAGQELSEHTAALPAVLQILSGKARLTLGPDEHQASAGAWVYMPANLPHSVFAETEVTMLLTLVG
jgi:quercetin dioxygenase-like cupin family protein